MKSELEEILAFQVKAYKLPEPARDFRFCPGRKFMFDFAWAEKKLAAECEGGIWTFGRHTRGAGFLKDMEKYNLATLMGWDVYRFDGGMVKRGDAVAWLARLF